MSDPIGTYTFLPWLRRGVANRIDTAAGDPAVTLRASIKVSVDIEAAKRGGGQTTLTVQRPVELYGPGDIVGVERAAILRTDPAHWVTNFEPNYLVAIEFYEEDFPWRYTPAAPEGRRLQPWLALVVLEEGAEFQEGAAVAERPLPYITVTAEMADVIADPFEQWAWTHVHFNRALSATDVVATNSSTVGAAAAAAIAQNPDSAYSRILCPRKLAPHRAYHAFLVPAFESGRLAGLGIDPATVFAKPANELFATASVLASYADKPPAGELPYYHRWYFRTGARGDFEYLVRLLKPKVVDSRVGSRDLDVRAPAPNISGIDTVALSGVLRMGGALRAPLATMASEQKEEHERYDNWAQQYPHAFQSELAAFVNLADSYQANGVQANADPLLHDNVNADDDPLVVPPIYGRWHALTERLLTERDGSQRSDRENWVHDLNLDPRWRAAAGLGTGVVQAGQEEYMAAAWAQIGDVLEANRRIRQAHVATQAGRYWYQQIAQMAGLGGGDDALMLYAPMHGRVVSQGQTVLHQIRQSPLQPAITSTAMRRAIRPRARLALQLGFEATRNAGDLLTRVNAGEILAAPPKQTPPDLPTPDAIADAIEPGGAPVRDPLQQLADWVRAHHSFAALLLIVLAVMLLLAILAGAIWIVIAVVGLIVAVLAALHLRPPDAGGGGGAPGSIREEEQTPESVDALPGSSGFTVITPIDVFTPPADVPIGRGEVDSAEATRFKAALRDAYTLVQESERLGRMPRPVRLDIPLVVKDLIAATDPALTVPRWVLNGLTIPPRIREQIGERFVEAMAYPEFDTPMYRPLVDAGDDLFVPNLHLVEPDSLTLLETNQRFVESYMVGLNHEFARELLWREYPTDQRGSYFRQFWDARSRLVPAADAATAREDLKDIPPLHLWSRASNLGEHDHREAQRENEEELVLVVRGELLKKYPNAVITAQRARWQPQSTTDPTPDKSQERRFDESAPPITPLYEARVAPDLYFFGFDLTAVEAAGDDTVDDKPGWFFRLEEVPGDARFGFDIERDGPLNVWNDLSWPDVAPALADGGLLKASAIPARKLVEPTAPEVDEKLPQWESDRHVLLDAAVSSAELAYIALQTPVIMAVHASEMLPKS